MTETTFLVQQGTQIAAAIAKKGYQTRYLNADLIAWEVTGEDNYWTMLTWIPKPVAQWRFLPVATDDQQQQLYSILEQTIGGRR